METDELNQFSLTLPVQPQEGTLTWVAGTILGGFASGAHIFCSLFASLVEKWTFMRFSVLIPNKQRREKLTVVLLCFLFCFKACLLHQNHNFVLHTRNKQSTSSTAASCAGPHRAGYQLHRNFFFHAKNTAAIAAPYSQWMTWCSIIIYGRSLKSANADKCQ